ncbi:hypothetical protein EG328_004888 [Venturia inaequalis]|uniref:Uncharacterized protein n=1 Tax=Venturia inaequalis TaxID=5025 RepID=A0A8H3UMZ4_VENIN|nr:hypothetical protein EG328_004888 [Venturia inaequalis]
MQFSLSIIFATLLAAGVNAQVAESCRNCINACNRSGSGNCGGADCGGHTCGSTNAYCSYQQGPGVKC